LGGRARDGHEILVLQVRGDSGEQSPFVLAGASLGEDLFAEICGIDFDFDSLELF
jgi:hypothetical protein